AYYGRAVTSSYILWQRHCRTASATGIGFRCDSDQNADSSRDLAGRQSKYERDHYRASNRIAVYHCQRRADRDTYSGQTDNAGADANL
ncbi:MAG TPA: hypothetical protein VKU87_01140, partial [Thermomicrobiaceae bacterium]|nr:hypothetical protein [Thermomicrobiaceae bacterium]